MRKIKLCRAFVLIFLFISLCALSGCTTLPDNYVEVDSLRIQSANIYLSPSGETAKKQLEVEILPANATNRKLVYYIPSEYLKYATVSETGLITALLTTEENMKVPLIVTSSTNTNAKLQINLVVEYVAVKEVYFTEDKLDMLYKSADRQLSVGYEPYHAQDGRAVTFSSLNEKVATVSSSGIVTPVNVGSTRIKATCKTSSGKAVEGLVPITVNYKKGRYRLEVSDTTPQYNQILGEFKPINFSLMILEPQSDPNPGILWYVDSEKVIGQDNFTQYEHIPTVSTLTSYKIHVVVTPYKQEEENLSSELITVYNIFKGFDVSVQNITVTGKGYQYGDAAKFPLTVSSGDISYYEWYLKKKNAVGKGIFVGKTDTNNKDLQRRLNLEGDFSLTAEGKDSGGNTISTAQKFDFSVTRFNIGDTLILHPKLLKEGKPPESYNWFKYELDNSGTRISDSVFVGSSVYGTEFYYPLTSNNYIELVAFGMLEGVVATVDNLPFEGSTGIVRVYGTSSDSQYTEDIVGTDNFDYHYAVTSKQKVDNVVIEGVVKDNQNLVNIHWSPTSNAPSYVVEIAKKGGKIYLLDSAVDTAAFGDYYAYVPSSIVTLEDSFTVRVKQKGGLFSERYYYNIVNESQTGGEFYFDKIESVHYQYLSNINENVNRYVLSMSQLGQVLDYIMLYTPRSNPLITYKQQSKNDIVYDTYAVRLLINIDYTSELAQKYPVTAEDGTVSSEYLTLYKMILGAQKSYCETGQYIFSLTKFEEDGSYGITIMKPNGEEALKSTEAIDFVAGDSVYYATTPYVSGTTTFAIDLRQQSIASTTDQLYSLAEQGKCPLPYPSSGNVYNVYEKAKSVVKDVIGVGMTDRQKVLAFYDYLTTNIVYDTQIKTLIDNETVTLFSAYNYDSFHLEGVFNKKKAVCDGIAKAMSLLCAIEGIYCVKVTGTIDGVGHSWNKVLIDDEYYYLDATYGIESKIKIDICYQYSNHKYFLMTDSEFVISYTNAVVFGEYPAASDSYDFYGQTTANGISITISSQEELKTLLDSFGDTLVKRVYLEIKISDSYLLDGTIDALFTDLVLSGNKQIAERLSVRDNKVISDDRIIIVMQ